MRIKSLELLGFKSFLGKTSISFQSGVNAIVGPNGCGKTNILDSIKWVLGEQNPRLIRAKEMEQVISNGGDGLKPLGMAEVTMVLDDTDDKGFEEIEIKRRLFRSGESEYYINGVPVRLKDIVEMFMDTGAGARAYSIVDQEKVDQLINTKWDHRKSLIEEIAGIQKYKLRRRETESRIESTKENLERLGDIIIELDKQKALLSEQVSRANEFKRLTREVDVLELTLLKKRQNDISHRADKLSNQISRVMENISSLTDGVDENKNTVSNINSDLIPLNSSMEREHTLIEEIKQNHNNKISLVERSKTEIAGIENFTNKMDMDLVELNNERSSLLNQNQELEQTIASISIELDAASTELNDKEKSNMVLTEQNKSILAQLESTRKELFEIINDLSSLKASLYSFENEVSDLKTRALKNINEKNQIESEKQTIKSDMVKLKAEINRISNAKVEIEDQITELNGNLQMQNEIIELKKNEKHSVAEKINERSSRLNALKQIESRYEWLPEEIGQYVVGNKGNGVFGIVSDFLKVEKGYEMALEAALEDKINWILVRDAQEAFKAADILSNIKTGRATVFPVDGSDSFEKQYAIPQGSIRLSEVVDVKNINNDLINILLKGAFLVDSINDFKDRCNELQPGDCFVTMRGDILRSNGAISVGLGTAGVMERKSEIEELKYELEELEKVADTMTNEITEIEGEISEYVRSIGILNERLVEMGIKDAEMKRDSSNFEENFNRLNKRTELIEFDLKQINLEILDKEQEVILVGESLTNMEERKDEHEIHFKKMKQESESIEETIREHELLTTNLRVANASLNEKLRSFTKILEEQQNRINNLNKKIETESKDIDLKNEEMQRLIALIQDSENDLAVSMENLKIKEGNLVSSRIKCNELASAIKSAEEEIEKFREELLTSRQKQHELNMELEKYRYETEQLAYNIIEIENKLIENQIDPATVVPLLDGLSLSVERQNLNKLKKKLELFGAVNLLAPEEYKKLDERYEFLTSQVNDLDDAIQSLKRAMAKIDVESKKRFFEGFEMVNTKFSEVFEKLFHGGEGKLILTDPDDYLETGVEIMVRPKGKKFQTVNLLSGGEKALSGLALVLAACYIRPAPFLLFDEIDAPLDDSNTIQLAELLKTISRESQILLISHNKKTMQYASSLIGITSEIPGVSSVVSVELN